MFKVMTVLGFAAALGTMLGLSAASDPGVVNVYSARHYDTDDALYRAFTEQTGIKVNVIEGKSDELLARLQQEGELSPADVFVTVDAGRLHRAEERGVFQPVQSELLEARVPDALRHPDGLWFGLTKRVRVIVASVDRVATDRQLDYEDLTDPEWRERVLIRSSSNIYNQSLVASMIETEGASATEQWCRGMVANFARKPQGGDRDQIRAVAAGEGDVAVVNHYYYAQMTLGSAADREAASKVRVIFPNQNGRGTHVNVSGIGVVKTAPNRDNAVRFIEYLASDEAQRVLASGTQEYPVVATAPQPESVRALGSFRSDEVNASKLGEHNAEAVRIMDRAGWR